MEWIGSSDFPGIPSNHSLQRNVISHMEIEEIIYGLDTIGIWYLWKTWKGKHNYGFNCVIFGLNEGKYGCRESGNSDQYKNHRRSFICCITFLSFLISLYNKDLSFAIVCLIMTQSQLLGSGGDSKEGEGARKRLKISVPHFDNSALVKTYSKSLIGTCMNPPEQDMQALIQNIPKIWKLEDRIVGTDLGFGKFQFDFQTEEEIEAVLKLQPYHFDYWMLAIARWQPRKSQLFPSEIPFWVRV